MEIKGKKCEHLLKTGQKASHSNFVKTKEYDAQKKNNSILTKANGHFIQN